jgi:ribosomal protein S18 acetylase RimI-like enzyme
MEIKILTKTEQDKYDNEILEMLIQGDTEFVPPLSARSSTTQSNLTGIKNLNVGVSNYFNELKKQRILVATAEDKLLGFVSFKENFVNEKIGKEHLPNIYISTLLVSSESRGKGLTSKMYESLFAEYENVNIFTRTWSTNVAHIKILSKFGFETMLVIKNDRGNGVDTIYFKKSIKTH